MAATAIVGSQPCRAIRLKRKLNSTKVTDALTDLCIIRGVPGYLRSDHGPQVIAAAVRMWIKAVAVNTADIEPAASGKNGCCESFNGRMRDESRNGEVFNPLPDAPVIIEQ
jgi:hypothetical protein